MKFILFIALDAFFCIIYTAGGEIMNFISPLFFKHDITMGITIFVGKILLAFALFVCLLIKLLRPRRIRILYGVSYAIILIYWVQYVDILPYRTWAYVFMSFALISIYIWFLQTLLDHKKE